MFKVLKFPELRKKIFFSLFVIIIFRLLAHIPVPGVDTTAIKSYLSQNAILGLFDLFSGGGFQNFSIVTMGLNPYINASIIIQLFTMLIPSLEELSKEGESGREKISMYTRLLTLPIAILQSYGMYFLLSKSGVISTLNAFQLIILVLTLTAGTMLLMWIGELVTEYGVGQGISLLIFAGIISRLPASVVQLTSTITTSETFINLLIFTGFAILAIAAVVIVNEGTRNIAIEYGRRSGTDRANLSSNSQQNYLPIKINQAGVIPIIFAVSVVLIPSLVATPLQTSSVSALQTLGRFFAQNFNSQSPVYNAVYFLLVFGFTYFYTSVNFNPEKIADDIKKRGGFVPGIRPGKSTTEYLNSVITKITLSGALFLGIIAILPYLVTSAFGISNLEVGGTSLLIVVSVVLETIRQMESLMVSQNYNRFLD